MKLLYFLGALLLLLLTPLRVFIKTNESLEIIEVQSGTYLGEDDIVHLKDMYGRS